MWVVGLTGGIGCGKSSACAAFAQLGVPIIDTDQIAHSLSATGSPLLEDIRRHFGDAAIDHSGALNRPWIRELIFSNASDKEKLENIFHPAILAELTVQLRHYAHSASYCILAVPLLFESPQFLTLVNYSLVIDCNEARQIERVKQRSGLSEAQINKIMKHQLPRQLRNQQADKVISNNGELHELHEKVSLLHDFFLLKSQLMN